MFTWAEALMLRGAFVESAYRMAFNAVFLPFIAVL